MLEIQKAQIYQRSRLRAKGASDEEIARLQQPFKPAFVNGKRQQRESTDEADRVPTEQFAFRRER